MAALRNMTPDTSRAQYTLSPETQDVLNVLAQWFLPFQQLLRNHHMDAPMTTMSVLIASKDRVVQFGAMNAVVCAARVYYDAEHSATFFTHMRRLVIEQSEEDRTESLDLVSTIIGQVSALYFRYDDETKLWTYRVNH